MKRKMTALLLAAMMLLSVVTETSASNFRGTIDDPTPITLGEVIKANITTDYEIVWFSFTPETHGIYCLESYADGNTIAVLCDADGNEICSDDDSGIGNNFKLSAPLQADREYLISVRLYGSGTETFNITLTFEEVTPITMEEDIVADITTEGKPVWFSFTPEASGIYCMAFHAEEDTFVTLFGDDSRAVMSDYNNNEGNNFKMNAFLQAGLTYFYCISFLWDKVGSFPITMTFSVPTPVALEEDITVDITAAGEPAWFVFTPETSDLYCLESHSSDNPYVMVYDANLKYLDSNDNGGEDGNFNLHLSLTAGQTYFISAWLSDSGVGSYSMTITQYVIPTSGQCGDELFWEMDRDTGLLTLTGTGDMWNWEDENDRPWHELRGEVSAVSLPDGLTSIGSLAFYMMGNLHSLTIPDTVTYIGYDVIGWSSIDELLIPASVTSIDNFAFYCSYYVTFYLYYGSCAVELAESYHYTYYLVDGCEHGIHNYVLSDQLVHTDSEPGWRVWTCSFCQNSYTEEIPAGHVYNQIIERDKWMTTCQCDYCDATCEKDISIPMEVGVECPVAADHLYGVWLRFTAPKDAAYEIMSLATDDGPYPRVTVYNGQDAYVYQYSGGGDYNNFRARVVIDEGETFHFCVAIGNVQAGEIVNVILQELKPCGDEIYWEFDEQTGLLTISGYGEEMYDYEPGQAPWAAYSQQITKLSMQFGHTANIGRNAFYGCTGLTEVDVNNVRTIGYGAFQGCENLMKLNFWGAPNVELETSNNGQDPGEDADKVLGVPGQTVIYGEAWCRLQDYAEQYGYEYVVSGLCGDHISWWIDQENEKLIMEGYGPTYSSNFAFRFFGAQWLNLFSKAIIPDTVTELGRNIFNGYSSLKEITLPLGLTSVGYCAFKGASGLESVTILDPDCVIESSYVYFDSGEDLVVDEDAAEVMGNAEKTVIISYPGSDAERYALQYGYTFRPLCNFEDVNQEDYYYIPVSWAVGSGITDGTSDVTYSPNGSCKRKDYVTFLWRAAGSPEPETLRSSFTDVEPGSYYEKAVIWAMEQGITEGVSSTKFGINRTCTRAQAVTFLWRAAGKPEPESLEHGFQDVRSGVFFEKAVAWAVEQGITNGVSEAVFSPNGVCTRGQVMTFLWRNRRPLQEE